jgi:hypothetical protein
LALLRSKNTLLIETGEKAESINTDTSHWVDEVTEGCRRSILLLHYLEEKTGRSSENEDGQGMRR